MMCAVFPYKGVETIVFVFRIALMNFGLDC